MDWTALVEDKSPQLTKLKVYNFFGQKRREKNGEKNGEKKLFTKLLDENVIFSRPKQHWKSSYPSVGQPIYLPG